MSAPEGCDRGGQGYRTPAGWVKARARATSAVQTSRARASRVARSPSLSMTKSARRPLHRRAASARPSAGRPRAAAGRCARRAAGAAGRLGRIHQDHHVERVGIGHLEEQRDVGHDDPRPGLARLPPAAPRAAGSRRGARAAFRSSSASGRARTMRAQRRAVERTVGPEHAGAEAPHDGASSTGVPGACTSRTSWSASMSYRAPAAEESTPRWTCRRRRCR